MVPADDEHTGSTKATSNTNTKERDPARLPHMPAWLMKWWIQFGLAGLLLAICIPIAFWWGGHFHWPSADGISVCITIAGAALAFSSWQQRIEDNVKEEDQRAQEQRKFEADRQERERIRLAQIERDEYWKRRENILHTLDSNNPGIRLAAISLLAELADSAAHSNLLNHTAQQQLQQHIISTLCLQLRHEGQLLKSEGAEGEHAEIQNAILQVILERIQDKTPEQVRADWSQETIDLRSTSFATDLLIEGITSNSTIKLNSSHFQNGLGIFGSKLGQIDFNSCIFDKYLFIGNDEKPVTLHCEAIAITCNGNTRFKNTTFITDSGELFTSFETPTDENNTRVTFEACRFYNHECKCPATCSCKSKASTGACRCLERKDCNCSSTCINTAIKAVIPESTFVDGTNRNTLVFTGSKIRSIELYFTYRHHPSIHLTDNTFIDELEFHMHDTDPEQAITKNFKGIESNPSQSSIITVKANTFITSTERAPISISITAQHETTSPFEFSSNYLISPTDYSSDIPTPNEESLTFSSTPQKHQKLVCKTDNTEPERYHFSAHPYGSTSPLIAPWDSGRFCPPNSSSKEERISSSLACTYPNTHNSFTIIAPTDNTYPFNCSLQVRQQYIEYFISLSTNLSHPEITPTLNTIDTEHCYFVNEDTTPQAIFCLTPGNEHTYQKYEISWNLSSRFNMIHSIFAFGKQGIIQRIFDYATEHSDYLRCDTNAANYAMLHALEVFGFKRCGTFTADDGSTWVAYDWIKETEPHN